MYARYYLPLVIWCITITCISAQTWTIKVEKEGYTEGTYSLPVSTPVLTLVSLTSYFEPYQFNNSQELKVIFFSPDDTVYFIRAEEQRITAYYLMLSNPMEALNDWNLFGPWQVDGELNRLGINRDKLGLLISLNNDNSREHLPAIVYHSNKPDMINAYTAVFRLGINIRRARYHIYKGKFEGIPESDALLSSGTKGTHLGSSNFSIDLETDTLNDYEGWLTVDITLYQYGSPDRHGYKFYFYHKNLK